jgi:ATP-binding cassette subfamily C protein CydC
MIVLFKLLTIFRAQAGWLILGLFLAVIGALANISLMAISGWFLSSMALAGIAGTAFNYFTPAAIIRFLAIIRSASRYGERVFTHEATFRLLTEIRLWFYHKLEPLIPGVINQYRQADLYNRIQSDINHLEEFYLRIVTPLFVAAIVLILCFFYLYSFDHDVAYFMLGIFILVAWVIPYLAGSMANSSSKKLVAVKQQLQTGIIDLVSHLPELEMSASSKQFVDRIRSSDEELNKYQAQQARLSGITNVAVNIGLSVSVLLILWLGISAYHNEQITGPQLTLAVLLIIAAFETITPLPAAFRLLPQVKESAQRLFELVDQHEQEKKEPLAKPEHYYWRCEKISITSNEGNILNNVSLEISSNKKMMLTGASGSGKSTLAQALIGLRNISSGQILIDDRSTDDYPVNEQLSWVAYVPQQDFIFAKTIRENLLIAKPTATDEDLYEVLDVVQLTDRIQQIPGQLDSWVEEGGQSLSGGELKRLAIARALLKPHQLLILDEPLENLDANTAKGLMHNLLAYPKIKALLMISHRLICEDQFDEILLMDSGSIIEQGTHAELMSKQASYFSLHQ